MLREDGIRMALSRGPVIRFPYSEERGGIKRFGGKKEVAGPVQWRIVYLLSVPLSSEARRNHSLAANCLDPFFHYFQAAFYGFFDIVKGFFQGLPLGDATRNRRTFHDKPSVFSFTDQNL
jgi:hypothetical protein